MSENKLSFEQSFEKLETILEKMNSNEITLDESLNLFEQADALIKNCNQKLNAAEQKIEILIKNRNNEITLDQNQTPQTKPFLEKPNASLDEEIPF
ncbi:MAG TPA: exodeoxyribonuclease VII small subunit [Chlamydiales bacterium]|nr:exodeoxyribonuclease VII small subunit [Chlamydiales bacterium]